MPILYTYCTHKRSAAMPSPFPLNAWYAAAWVVDLKQSACVPAYPVVERHRFIWLWMGDPALADPALVPDMHWNDDPAWAGDGKTIQVKCDYRLVVDNLMDLTHETFVHGSSIGNEHVAEAPFHVTHGDKTVTVTRRM